MHQFFTLVFQKNLPFLKGRKRMYSASFTKDDYFERYSFAGTLNQLLKVLQATPSPVLLTQEKVCFQNIPFGTSLKEVVKVMGKPQHEVSAQAEVPGHKAFIFKRKVGPIGVTSCLHFLHGKLFLAQCVVRHPSPEEVAYMASVLQEKFPPVHPQEVKTSFAICDGLGNQVVLDQTSYLRINYIWADEGVRYALHALARRQKVS